MKKNKWIIVFIIALTFFSLSFFKVDPDYLWHVKAGEYMVHHGLITKDVFSWSVYSKYWMCHEWLFEVLIYGLKQLFGSFHLFIYCFVCNLSLLLFLYYSNRENVHKNLLFTIIWFACSFVLCFTIQGRPHMISNILLALSFYCIYDLYKNEESKKIYFLPIITILWANIHGGSSNMPYLLCFLVMIAGAFRFQFSKIEAQRISKKQYLKYLVVMFACMVCVCINPHGFKMFLYPYENMMDTTMLQNISEWRSTSLNEPVHYLYFLLLLVILGNFLISKKKIDFVEFVIFAFCTYLGLKSIRFWSYTYIILFFVVYQYIGSRKEDNGTQLGFLILSGLLFSFFVFKNHTILNPKYSFLLTDRDIQAVRRVNAERLFNMYDYGGDLVYHDISVFIDGRADLYGKYNYSDYLCISYLSCDYVPLIKKYHFDYFLVDSNYPISFYLKYHSDYENIYQNKNIILYKKRTV